jgi:large repetitive protein
MAFQSQASSKAVITSVDSAVSGGVILTTKPVINGTAEAGTTVNIYDGARLLGTATVSAGGTWSFTPPTDLKSGKHSFSAIAVDSTGHAGVASDVVAVTVQAAVAPVKPIVDGGATDEHGIPLPNPTHDPRPQMSGTGVPGDTITMYDGNTPIGSTIIGPDGKWTVKPDHDLADGPHDLYVIETTPAGVPSQPSDHSGAHSELLVQQGVTIVVH